MPNDATDIPLHRCTTRAQQFTDPELVAEMAFRAALHSAHVEAWMSAETCETCDRHYSAAQMAKSYRCKDCHAPIQAEELAQAKAEERYAYRVFGIRP